MLSVSRKYVTKLVNEPVSWVNGVPQAVSIPLNQRQKVFVMAPQSRECSWTPWKLSVSNSHSQLGLNELRLASTGVLVSVKYTTGSTNWYNVCDGQWHRGVYDVVRAGSPSEAVPGPDPAAPRSRFAPQDGGTTAYLRREAVLGAWRCHRGLANWSWASSRLITASNSRDSASVAPSLRPLRPSCLRREAGKKPQRKTESSFRGKKEQKRKTKKKLEGPIPRFPPPCGEKTV